MRGARMTRTFIAIGLALVVLHHDFWWWEASWPVLGFLPIGLAYHAVLALAAALFWVVVTRRAWPVDGDPAAKGRRD